MDNWRHTILTKIKMRLKIITRAIFINSVNKSEKYKNKKEMQNLQIESADSTTMEREPAVLHADRKQKVVFESLNDLTGEPTTSRNWLFIREQYVSIENGYQTGTKMMKEGVQEFVTTESLCGSALWQNFHDLLISNESIANINSNRCPMDLCLSLCENASNQSEMDKIWILVQSQETSFLSKMEIMKAMLTRNSIVQNMIICLNLKRDAIKSPATTYLLITIMEQCSTASVYTEVNLSKMGRITIFGQITGQYLSFRNHLWRKAQAAKIELKDMEMNDDSRCCSVQI